MAIDKFPVEAGHILMFARALDDTNSAYSGEADEVLAPPTFVQSSAQFDPDYPLRPKHGKTWFGSGKTATGLSADGGSDGGSGDGGGGAGAGMLHAEQHYSYHQPLQAGDMLTATHRPGKSWEKESKRAGKLKFSETITEYRNQKGELVVTARSVGVVTEKVIRQ